MTINTEKNSLSKFKEEILDQGAESCLPKNLSHFWLHTLATQANALLREEVTPDDEGCAELIGALICLLFYKNGDANSLEFSWEEMFEHCQNYAIELSLEEVHRKTEMKYEAATLDTILNRRDVQIWEDDKG